MKYRQILSLVGMVAAFNATAAPDLEAIDQLDLGPVDQIGIVGDDIEAMALRYGKLMGVGKFYEPTAEVVYADGSEALLWVGYIPGQNNVQYEIIEPVSEGPNTYTEFVDGLGTKNSNIHHYGFVLNDKEYDQKVALMQELGYPMVISGDVATSLANTRFSYYDTADDLGVLTELINNKSKLFGISLGFSAWETRLGTLFGAFKEVK